MSFYAKYWAKDKTKGLIGDVVASQSSRFGSIKGAQCRLDTSVELNGSNCEGIVVPSNLPPEIFSHCDGSLEQALGCPCFKCGKILTKEDAREFARNHRVRK